MTRFRIFVALSLIAGLGACAGKPESRVVGAEAHLIDPHGIKIGEATFSESERESGVVIRLRVWSVPAGVHGMHIHDSGSCETPEFKSAGGHFNPFGKKHGLNNPEGPHLGDLPNLVVPSSGKAEVTILVRGATLGSGTTSLLRPQGASLVLHADPDDGISDPAGNSGARIACGVIRRIGSGELEAR